jgi:hypothetical protein
MRVKLHFPSQFKISSIITLLPFTILPVVKWPSLMAFTLVSIGRKSGDPDMRLKFPV